MFRWGRRVLVAAAIGALVLGGLASPASASTSAVDGADALGDDFGDHFEELGNSLCNGCGDSSGTDLVVMWQTILFAEGLLPKSAIDGYFGPKTEFATITYQKKWRFDLVDGKVGDGTWGFADNRLKWMKIGTSWYVRYLGMDGGYVDFTRGRNLSTQDDGGYRIKTAQSPGSGSLRATSTDEYGIELFSRTVTII